MNIRAPGALQLLPKPGCILAFGFQDETPILCITPIPPLCLCSWSWSLIPAAYSIPSCIA